MALSTDNSIKGSDDEPRNYWDRDRDRHETPMITPPHDDRKSFALLGPRAACAVWIHAGGAHHTGFSYSVSQKHLQDFADMSGIELLSIDAQTNLADFKQTLRNNEVYYHLAPRLTLPCPRESCESRKPGRLRSLSSPESES
jgi:hypothetical protein